MIVTLRIVVVVNVYENVKKSAIANANLVAEQKQEPVNIRREMDQDHRIRKDRTILKTIKINVNEKKLVTKMTIINVNEKKLVTKMTRINANEKDIVVKRIKMIVKVEK
jgi:hypothetical protein